jgi:hypothetical protein
LINAIPHTKIRAEMGATGGSEAALWMHEVHSIDRHADNRQWYQPRWRRLSVIRGDRSERDRANVIL